jgi:uncharacterized protein YprB with RNaseH-like and TPR domain
MAVTTDLQQSPIDWSRRLGRLRQERLLVPARAIASPDRRAPEGGGSAARALRLAEVLGGTVEGGSESAIVRFRAAVAVPAPSERLASLPWPVDPSRPLVCLDTETTGLGTAAGTVVFLVGLGRWEQGSFLVEQLILPDHPDEPAFLAALQAAIPPAAWLVTYNGRAFDWPLLTTRYRLHRGLPPQLAGHLDLLPVARQLWRHRLADARLSTVEEGIVGIRRGDDLPGALIPARYLEYLRTGRPELLRAVLQHNAQDVISLGLLLAHLGSRLADPQARQAEHPGDLAALGRAYARCGRLDEAIGCCDAAHAGASAGLTGLDPRNRYGASLGAASLGSQSDGPPAVGARERERIAADRARILRLAGHREAARQAWLDLALQGGRLAAHAWIQVAKHDEHVWRDPSGALTAAQSAARLIERDRLLGRPTPAAERGLRRRLERLRSKVERQKVARPEARPEA